MHLYFFNRYGVAEYFGQEWGPPKTKSYHFHAIQNKVWLDDLVTD